MDFIYKEKGLPKDYETCISKITVLKNLYTFTSNKGFKNVYTIGRDIQPLKKGLKKIFMILICL